MDTEIETAPEQAATAATAPAPLPQPPVTGLIVLGSADAEACADGSCF
ncbi:hypothetical protein [Actinoplanes sp. N902-109]|nr:hypothetical protein [Actinoplanes sp. N902-109]AGL17877.1 hypothetical protein L083_4367 [Actinoplanes sp. N902-109]